MTQPSTDQLSNAASLEELYGLLRGYGAGAGWNKPAPAIWPSPRTPFKPAHWRYAGAKAALDAAGRLINTKLAERRNLILANPIPGNDYATTKTLIAAYQMILPGETARSHRHTPNALRVIVDAKPGTYTVVEGVRIPMANGDVVLTPSWSWHGHGNDGNAPATWIDFLDVPMIQLLEPMFFEDHPHGFETISRTDAHSPMLYPWAETERRLAEAKAGADAFYGTEIELGSPAMTTIALHMMKLEPGSWTRAHRTTAGNIFAVVSGDGTSTIGGEGFHWSQGDVFAAPAWLPQTHCADDGAVLLRVSDEALLKSLKLLRRERV